MTEKRSSEDDLNSGAEFTLQEVSPNELPLTKRDETPPLLLDLPEGQQLVVGKLPDGIVIEIATWRGTGRPDSRTNRMMLGVSYDDDVIEESKKKSFLEKIRRSSEPVTEKADSVAVPEKITNNEIPTATNSVSAPASAVSVPEPVTVQTPEPTPVQTPEPTLVPTPQPNIQRDMQDLMGARPRTQLVTEPQGSESRLNKHAHEIVKREIGQGKKTSVLIYLGKWAASIAAVAMATFLAMGPGNLRIVHPDLGLRTSLSSAEDSLILVRKSEQYAVGESVVVRADSLGSPNVFGTIAALSDKEYIVEENSLYHSSTKESVYGKVVLVMPGLGKVFSIFN
jgi:hypothetical protein